MIRKKGSLSWILAWSCSLLVAISILSVGYFSKLSTIPLEKGQVIKQKRLITSAPKTTSSFQTPQTGLEQEPKTQSIMASKEPALTYKDFPSPVQGKLLRGIGNYYFETFESYMFHPGKDFLEPEGTIIRATHGGKVVYAGDDPLLGQKVVLDCRQGWIVTYGGLENLRVKVGQMVEKQGLLGQVGYFPGAEGINNQPQLHYEVWCGNKVQSTQ